MLLARKVEISSSAILPNDSAFVVWVLDMDTPGVGPDRVGDDGGQAYQHVARTSRFI